MAAAPILKIDGSEVKNVLEVSYALRNGADADGKPIRFRQLEGISITRILDDNTLLADWARSPREANWKSGEIQFTTDTGLTMKTLTWKKGYLSSYDVHHSPYSDHVLETATIQAEQVECGGTLVDFDWTHGK